MQQMQPVFWIILMLQMTFEYIALSWSSSIVTSKVLKTTNLYGGSKTGKFKSVDINVKNTHIYATDYPKQIQYSTQTGQYHIYQY